MTESDLYTLHSMNESNHRWTEGSDEEPSNDSDKDFLSGTPFHNTPEPEFTIPEQLRMSLINEILTEEDFHLPIPSFERDLFGRQVKKFSKRKRKRTDLAIFSFEPNKFVESDRKRYFLIERQRIL